MEIHKLTAAAVLAVSLTLASCATSAQYAQNSGSQKFQDGAYNVAVSTVKEDNAKAKANVAQLSQKTQGSTIYLKQGQTDSLFIPEHMSATLKLHKKDSSTVITLYDMDDSYGYSSSWWAYRPWYYGGIYNSWYSPWHYGYGFGPYHHWAMYDPWYWDYGFYSPWTYSSLYWDPFFYDPYYWGYGYGYYGFGYGFAYNPWYFGYWGAPVYVGGGYHSNGVYTNRGE
ncbi:MAG: hypothetical protein MJZ16_13495, partial [Bacteroidales bacterium]|nr:hypothetical protein [Bacteroidales bacterium]